MSNLSPRKVLPSGPKDAPIMFIGEAPGYEEDQSLQPFVGDAGEFFNQALGKINLSRDEVYVTNLCNYRPNNNKFEHCIGTPQLVEGINEIQSHITTYKPKWVVLLGRYPLEYIGRRHGIENWRGSVIPDTNYFCSLHPAAVLWNRSQYPIFSFDFQRLKRYYTKGYTRPAHDFTIDPSGIELEECIQEILSTKEVTVDIEGVKGTTHILCCGFGLSKSRAICFVNHGNGDIIFFNTLRRILESDKVKKIFQNGFGYDIEMFKENSINVVGYEYDTMIGAHLLEPEMPYGLDFLTSIYTDEPYYKDKGKSAIPDDDVKGWSYKVDRSILYDYNCTDVITDYEISIKQRVEITERNLWRKYNYKHSLIEVSQSLSRSGLPVDETRNELLRQAIKKRWKYYQEILNAIAGFNVNVKSSKDMKTLLLDKFKLPERKNRGQGVTFDEDAIVSYLSLIKDTIESYKTQSKKDEWEFKLAACKCILMIRGDRTLLSNFIHVKDRNGRIYSIYNLSAATETGRGSSHKYIDGTGNNAQTWPRERLEITEADYKEIMEKINANIQN